MSRSLFITPSGLLLLPATGIEDARLVAEKLREVVAANPSPVAGKITLSIGVAASKPEDANEDAIVSRADKMLYAAKRAGRNCVMADL